MKYAWPQFPSDALDAIRRHDESTDSATAQSNLERQQDLAVVGETVPMIFCHRFDWGDDLGENGGVWISPRLIQLGIEETNLSMMYLLSQGKVEGLQTENTYWGYDKLTARDPSAQMCYAYEAVPDCLDLDYDPGGSLSWTTTRVVGGPSLNSTAASFTSSSNVVKMVVTFNSNISVSGSAAIVSGFTGYTTLYSSPYLTTIGCVDMGGTVLVTQGTQQPCTLNLWNRPPTRTANITGGIVHRYYEFAKLHKSASWTQTSQVRYDWRVRDITTQQVVKSGTVWISHGTQSLTIDGLPQGQYSLEFDGLYKQRNRPVGTYVIPNPGTNICTWYSYYSNALAYYYGTVPTNGFATYTYAGSETQNITTTITQTILNVIDFPDLPGGDQQIVGGLSDLTMMGIAGDITALRPQEGPEYFIQSHIFVEQGIEVERLTMGGTGSSPYYGDLVNYLFTQSKLLQADQIDKDSLTLANQVNTVYDMYFNGVLQTTNSLSEWLTRTAPYFLMSPRQVDGKYGLKPVCPVNAANELSRDSTIPATVVTRDDIVEGSYTRSYISPRDRRPVCLIMVYRDQPIDAVGQTVTVEVRYPGTALSGPFESHDLTEFCCRGEQAVYAARYILSKRRYTTHTVSFVMNRRAAQLSPGEIIKVDLAFDTTDGQGVTDSIFYQIESLTEGQAGTVAIEATHFPTQTLDGVDDVSVIAYEVHKGNVSIQ